MLILHTGFVVRHSLVPYPECRTRVGLRWESWQNWFLRTSQPVMNQERKKGGESYCFGSKEAPEETVSNLRKGFSKNPRSCRAWSASWLCFPIGSLEFFRINEFACWTHCSRDWISPCVLKQNVTQSSSNASLSLDNVSRDRRCRGAAWGDPLIVFW